MKDLTPLLLILIGFLLLSLSLYLRSKMGSRYELKSTDIVLLLLPLVLWLFFTGKIGRVNVFGVEMETASVIVDASREPIDSQVTELSKASIEEVVREMEPMMKGGVDRIPRLIREGTEALQFQLGHGGYWGPAVRRYFESLVQSSSLKYIVVNERDGRLFGFYDARSLIEFFSLKDDGYEFFAGLLNEGDERAREELSQLPSFIPGDQAVQSDERRVEVLQRLENLNAEVLPVVNEQHHFVGVVDRSRLTASLIVDIYKKLEKE